MRALIVAFFVLILQIVAFCYDILTFPIYYMVQKPWEVTENSNRKKAYKSSCSKELIWVSLDAPHAIHVEIQQQNLDTMSKTMNYFAKKNPNRNCLGTRTILWHENELQPDGRSFVKYNMGDYVWKTFAQVNILSLNFSKGMIELGCSYKQNVAIFAETREEWMIAAQGLFKQSIPIVTVYATLGEEGIMHAINETEVSVVVTSHDLLPKLKNILQRLVRVDTIIYFEDSCMEFDCTSFGCKGGYRLIKFSDVLRLGSVSRAEIRDPKPDDLAVIMYTSGSTGIPKGVMLTHENIMTTMRAFCDCTYTFGLKPDDCMLGFLPLAHIFEMVVECVCLCSGVAIGYSTPNTLIDTSTKIRRGSTGDATILKPTLMTSVPLILDRLAKAVKDKVNHAWLFKQVLFKFGYEYKTFWWKRGYSTPIINLLVFKKVRKILGGELRLILCGGAPLAVETQEFVETCLCVHIINGYGLTETTSCATVMNGDDRSLGRVGGATTCTKLRLLNWDEGGYYVTDKPNPRGEILVGGKNVSAGYYKLQEKTKEDFFTDNNGRWFRTGDIGEIHRDGCLKVIDRRKDLVKLQSGEYISLGKIEAELKTVSIVDNVCIAVDSQMSYCIALVSPNQNALFALGSSLGLKSNVFEDLCSSPVIQSAVSQLILEHCKIKKMEKVETPGAVRVCQEPWTPDSGLVTSAFKLRRTEIYKFYKKEIDEMYNKHNVTV